MERRWIVAGFVVIALAGGSSAQQAAQTGSADDQLVASLLESLGKDADRPAGEVFRNVQLMGAVTAGDLLRIMQNGYGRALNVRCSHCHVLEDWAADEIRAKHAAREMIQMVRSINDRLASMRDLDTETATVTCSTCHRGELRPAGVVERRSRRR